LACEEFLGRVDHQVKIRGYRIELEEIMNCVYQHRSVKECLVVAREPDYAGGEKYLVAYIIMESSVVGADDVGSNHHEARARMVQELRLLLEERLPAYMVPSHFMVLDKWPLSPNGKVDRTALPSPTRGGYVSHPRVRVRVRACVRVRWCVCGGACAVSAHTCNGACRQHEVGFNYAAPNTAAERTLVEVFESILHVSPVGVDDDFFALGGNSLLGVSLIGALEGKFGVRFPFSVIFSASTVRHLAVCIGEAHATSAATLLSCGGGRSAKTTEEDERRGRDSYDDLSVIVKNGPNAGVGAQQDQQPGLAPPAAAAVSSAAPTAVLAEKMSAAKRLISSFASPLVPLQTRGHGLPLFVIHPAFKSSVCYGALAYHLGTTRHNTQDAHDAHDAHDTTTRHDDTTRHTRHDTRH
jgi:acyl carrier protein